MANTSALKKGSPPKREQGQNIVTSDPRPSEGKNKPLQLMVPPEVFDAFSAEAGQRYGFTKGAKSKLFLEMWEAYKNS
jgi:hypothetical protein